MALGLLTAVLWCAFDQVSKWWILERVMVPPREIPVTGFFNIVLGANTGVSFGLFTGSPQSLLVVLGAALVGILLFMLWRTQTLLGAAGLGLVIGGAVGNIIDRLRRGGVTDFLDFYVGQWHWPTFNVADIGIVCGAGLLLLEGAFTSRSGRDRSAGACRP
jgi:signal peptidase II